jgi:hypothetical protein
VRKILQTIPLDLAHAIRRRCTLGILMVAQRLGVLWGLFSKK